MALVVHCGQISTLIAIYNYKLNVIFKATFSGSLQSSHKKNSDFSQVLPWEKMVARAPARLSSVQKYLYSQSQCLMKLQKRLLATYQNLQLTAGFLC